MNTQTTPSCRCSNCAGASCTCGCQAATAAPACKCGCAEGKPCGCGSK